MPWYDTEWLAKITGGRWIRKPLDAIRHVANDTRRISPGALYVALRGARFDGHAFAAHAFEAGASAAMIERGAAVALDGEYPLLEVENTQAALSALGAAHRAQVGPLVIGVTGSAGKTTVKEMTAAVLSAAGETARTAGNWNNEIGLPLSLLSMEMNVRYGVFEAGMNHPGEIQRLCEVLRPDWGIVTTVGPVHLEFFDSVEAIAREKSELLRALPAGGRAFLHRDSAWFPLLRDQSPCVVRTVSLEQHPEADLWIALDVAGRRLSATAQGEVRTFEWPWPGQHNALNAGFAILVGREAGLRWEQIQAGLATYQPLPMRWQEERIAGCLFINDAYNANPTSMRAALSTFATMHGEGRRWLVLGDMLELGTTGRDEHAALGEALAGGGWSGLLTVGPLAAHIAEGAERKGFPGANIWKCADTGTAATVLGEQIAEGDAILLKGSRGVALESILALVKNGKGEE